MNTTTNLDSASVPKRSDALHQVAVQLYERLASGHDGLAYNVDARGAALTAIGADGKRRPVEARGNGAGGDAPPWQRARELRDGAEVDRRFNAWVLGKHLGGRYSVAPAAAGWVQWVCLDIDAHPVPGAPELVARRLARARADRVLASVWRAFQCSAERHPIVERSPGGGYHVWFPLTRGATSTNPEHTWPAMVARAWFERHLVAAGVELAPGVLEVYPSGRCLRAPCGRGMMLLQATRPNDPDALGLAPWPGTMGVERVDWRGDREALSAPVRRVVPMAQAFVAQWDAQRRAPAEWLGRPEAIWDRTWGFLGWREEEDATADATGRNDAGTLGGEKNSGAVPRQYDGRSQQSDDVPGRMGAEGTGVVAGVPGRAKGRSDAGTCPDLIPHTKIVPAAGEVDTPPDPAGDVLVRGRAFKEKIQGLLAHGITEPSTRHDAVLCLAFYWGATCGLGEIGVLAKLEAWCKAHSHAGSRLASRPRVFRDTCLREARSYVAHYAHRWRFRGQGDGGGLATLTTADQAVLAVVDPRVRGEVSAILAWLAGRADGAGRVGDPVQIATGLLARLCGDRRIDDEGKRRRSTTLALVELERLGVLTMSSNYRVGSRGRVWCCWYRFGSGELPRAVEMPAAAWAAIEPSGFGVGPAIGIATPPEPSQDEPSAPIVVRVVGERPVPEGLVSVLSDGERGRPRTLVTLAPDVARPTAAPSERAPWFVRAFQAQRFTPAELWKANAATVIPFPDVEARRQMTRRERLAWGGGLAPVIPLRVAAGATEPATPLAPAADATGPAAPLAAPASPGPSADALRAEFAADLGAAADGLPLDLVEVIARAMRSWHGRDP